MQSMKLLLRSFALGLLMLGLAACAAAQRDSRGDDDGEYQILQAEYGTASRHVDVTQRLKALARQDRTFRMGNDSFGVDPHPNHVKQLRIHARGKNGQTRTFEYDEGSLVDGARFTGWGSGNWGRGGYSGGWGGNPKDAKDSRDGGQFQILQALYGTASQNVDVTQRLKELARSDRTFRMGNATFGTDPHPGQVKQLRIYTRGKDGKPRTFEYTEGSVVDGEQFTGWGGGDWGHGGWKGGWGDSGTASNAAGPLKIVSARYGADNRTRDVTQQLRARVRNNKLDLAVDNSMSGDDPAPNKPKALWVTYTVGNGKEQRVKVDENRRLTLP